VSPLVPVADHLATAALEGTGLQPLGPVHANLTASQLVTEALRRGEGKLSSDGALIVKTGVHTGRSVQDKFTVDDPEISSEIWWRMGNQKLPPANFTVFRGRVLAYLQGRELFTQDLYAGADPKHRIRVRLVSTEAWHTLFARNMFIRPPADELPGFKPDWVILHAPNFQADPASTASPARPRCSSACPALARRRSPPIRTAR
jgi:phosphoenolpyruvate carboxykinase (ATP)